MREQVVRGGHDTFGGQARHSGSVAPGYGVNLRVTPRLAGLGPWHGWA
jgi:hypothetical protein